MAVSRRSFLAIAGGAGVITAAGGTGFALTRTPHRALEPWTLAGSAYSDPRKRALSYALLCPNPHNMQPWIADLSEPDTVILSCDLEKVLHDTDPYNRQIIIGLGCFIELARMAAAQEGTRLEILPFPNGTPNQLLDERPVARLVFHRDQAEPDPLFAHVLERRTNREPFDQSRPVPSELLERTLQASRHTNAEGVLDPERIKRLKDIAAKAWVVECETERTRLESVRVMRIGKAEIEANPDGISLGGAVLEILAMVGLLNRDALADPTSFAARSAVDTYSALIKSSMGFIYTYTSTNSRLDQLATGYDWLRLNLNATALGLALQPLSQALQELPEMEQHFADLHSHLGVSNGTVQMFGRVGFAKQPAPSPRWRLETRTRE